MTEETRTMHRSARAIFLLFAIVAIACGAAAIKSYVEYRPPSHAKGEQQAISASFEDWKANFIAKLSEGTTDSTAGSHSQVSIPNDNTLKQLYDALKAKGLDTHQNLALLHTLLPGSVSLLAIVLCGIQWRLMRGMPPRLLAPLIPVILGLLSPTVAFIIGQLANSYVAGADTDLDGAVLQSALSLPLVTACTVPGFLGLAAFLYLSREPLTTGLLWSTSLIGTAVLTAMVIGSHTGMYDLLYSRGRMHSTTGIGIMFVSFYCLVAAAIISGLARIAQNTFRRLRARKSRLVGTGMDGPT